jgi:phage tail sheath gpL-like
MPVTPTSQAPATTASAQNKSLVPGIQNVESGVVIIGEYDTTITSVVPNVVKEVFNEADVGAQTGFGWPLQQLAKEVFKGTEGVGKVYMIPQTEAGTVADGEIAWSAGPVTKAGTVFLRIDNVLYTVDIPNATTLEEFSDAVVAAVNAVADCPVVAAKTLVTFETTFTSKAKGLEANNHTITLNAKTGESDLAPVGITGTITPMANGTGTPDIQDALDALGTGNGANGIGATHIIHNYGNDVATQAAVSLYQGEGNELTGLFAELVGRPFYGCLVGDTTAGTAGFTALKAITDLVVTDRINGFLAAPDEDEYPQALAARATGIMARIAQINPSKNYYGQVLSGMGGRSISANRWTDEYDGGTGRDDAAQAGISPTFVIEANQIELQNVFTFYRPTSIPINSNGFRSMRSNAITRNVIANIKAAFADAKGKTLVQDKSKVTDPEAKKDVMDVLDVETRINNLIDLFVGKGWFFDDAFAKATLDVQIRDGGNGFDATLQWVMSGEVMIIKVPTVFDTNIAAFAA